MNRRKSVSRWLTCKLTEYEHLERSRTMAECSKELARVEEQKASAMRAYGESIKKLKGELAALSETVSSGLEKRTVACFEDYEDGKMVLIRTDTYERIEDRRATDDERQAHLFRDGDDRSASEVIGRVIREAEQAESSGHEDPTPPPAEPEEAFEHVDSVQLPENEEGDSEGSDDL